MMVCSISRSALYAGSATLITVLHQFRPMPLHIGPLAASRTAMFLLGTSYLKLNSQPPQAIALGSATEAKRRRVRRHQSVLKTMSPGLRNRAKLLRAAASDAIPPD